MKSLQTQSTQTNAAPVSAGNVLPFPIQAKLTIGSPNDHYEQQADQVADQVVASNGAFVQRKCAACEHEEENIQRKPFNITPFIQKSGADGGGVASDAISSQIASSRGGGSPMGESTKNFMESRFGNDFSGVRIHTDSNAIQLSQNLNAQAFTVGNDVFFNEGKYNPESDSGKHLLAHELTHTVQQNGGIGRMVQRRILRDARVNHLCGSSEPFLRSPPTGFFRLNSGETEIRITSNIVWDRTNCSTDGDYYITLKRHREYFFDADHGTATLRIGIGQTHTFSELSEGSYYLEIRSANTNPNCCLTGNIVVEA